MLDAATKYCLILFVGGVFLWLSSTISAIFRGAGDMAYPSRLMIIASFVQVPLTAIFIFTFIQNVGLGYDKNMNYYKNPISAFLAFSFIYLTLLHFKQGAQVVIEDYVDDKMFHRALLMINVIFQG